MSAPVLPTVLIVIPTLNEAAHIGGLLDSLLPFAQRSAARIIVADGGSSDDTARIVAERAAIEPAITLLDNPRRLQSAAVNLAVERFGAEADWLIRIDAHAAYPTDYCETLLAEAEATGADSVVVGMRAVGSGFWQGLIAAAQNSRLGNGGSAHRMAPQGRFVEHGHHALMRIAAFRAVGGYDESFSHNEDAELDLRLRAAGYRIWLTPKTRLDYFPRRTIPALIRQYYLFGKGRARNLQKHRNRPGLRQMLVAALMPALLAAVLTPLSPVFALPLLLWLVGCTVGGVAIARQTGDPGALLSGLAAGVMHAAWSAGFWTQMLGLKRPQGLRA
ncbi:succinoglycan biosynthesis protein ExoA [Cereibacter changlensis]|uniref:Succinoglycan biosynthesis protein ExoA n=1 Tax=Cereibacter changlensis TaxID=402884 RepID=A0A2W7R0T6_9RHOB|nr:succinoglycan biosynthesis protein ExoA [Cereibacter changlensis]